MSRCHRLRCATSDMLHIGGVLDATAAHRLLPPGLVPAPGNACMVAIYGAPNGWGPRAL